MDGEGKHRPVILAIYPVELVAPQLLDVARVDEAMAVGRGLDEHHRREMVEVWHPEVAMSQAEIDEYLSGPWVARLATIGRDGYPHVYPFWYYWDGENIYLTPTRKRGSYKDLESNP